MAKIFISYKRQDKDKVFPIVEEIRQKTCVDCWIDLEGIESGDQFQNVIIDAIDNADIFVFMLSKNFIAPYKDEKTGEINLKKQTFPEKEVMYALNEGKRLIPLSIDGTTINDCKWLKFNCGGLNCIDWQDIDQQNKFLNNISYWQTRKICIIGEISSGKTSLLFALKKYYETYGLVKKCSLHHQDIYLNHANFLISNIQLLGNYLEIELENSHITIFDIALFPHLSVFQSFVENVDAIIYVKNINHFEFTQNDIFRISKIVKLKAPCFYIFTHCDTIDLSNILSCVKARIKLQSPNIFVQSSNSTYFLSCWLEDSELNTAKGELIYQNEMKRFICDFNDFVNHIIYNTNKYSFF